MKKPPQKQIHPSAFVHEQTNPAHHPTPRDAMTLATQRLECVAYARGFAEALSRLEMLAATVPQSVTKAKLIDMIKREASACVAKWNQENES
jgi:hypothetical protein